MNKEEVRMTIEESESYGRAINARKLPLKEIKYIKRKRDYFG